MNQAFFEQFLQEYFDFLEGDSQFGDMIRSSYQRVFEFNQTCPVSVYMRYLRNFQKELSYKQVTAFYTKVSGWFSTSQDLFIQWIEFERDLGDAIKCSEILQRGLSKLNESEKAELISKYEAIVL